LKKNISARGFFITQALVLFSFTCFAQKPAASGDELIRMMYRRYHDSWYKQISFEQLSTFYKNGKVIKRERWLEAAIFPGKLIIKFDSINAGNGLLCRDDSVFVYRADTLSRSLYRIHEIMLLGFDVYFYEPEVTIAKLKKLGFDLNKIYQVEHRGHPAYVVGGVDQMDNQGNRFMVDAENLYTTGIFMRENRQLRVTEIEGYRLFKKYPVATHLKFYIDNDLSMEEEYSKISFKKLSKKIFEKRRFSKITWK
jgi:hypothetical protein